MRRLPPGPHGLPPELVARNQRERLVAAMAEVCGERGYGETSVAEVAKRAGVSTASFYRHFEDKRVCMLASFEELFGRLLEAVEASCAAETEEGEGLRAGARAAAALLGADPPVARLLSFEILAVGPEGVLAQHRAIDRVASLLRPRWHRDPPLAPDKPDPSWAAATAVFALYAAKTAAGESPSVNEVEALGTAP